MSLGSNVKSKLLPNKILEIFVNTFAKLPYKVLWKFENDNFSVPSNVFISKWTPQQGVLGKLKQTSRYFIKINIKTINCFLILVLAHSNIKLFIYQGGLQSTEEAVHYAVPLIGIPFVFDQVYQVMKMVSLGVARYLDVVQLTTSELHDTILQVVDDKG